MLRRYCLDFIDDGTDSGTNVASNSSQLAIGYDHELNKYTTVYLAYAKVDNDDAATVTANNWGHGDAVSPAPGKDPSSLSLGVVVKFDGSLMR